jgi:predicted transcriptional regulator
MKEESDVDEGFINLGGAKVKDDEKSILQHIKKTFPNVKKVKKDSQHGWIPVFEAKLTLKKVKNGSLWFNGKTLLRNWVILSKNRVVTDQFG